MKNFKQNNYHKHLMLGALIGILTSVGLNVFNHDELSVNVAVSTTIGLLAGAIWEGEQTFRYQGVKWDWWDVILSAVGSGAGGLIVFLILKIFKNV